MACEFNRQETMLVDNEIYALNAMDTSFGFLDCVICETSATHDYQINECKRCEK